MTSVSYSFVLSEMAGQTYYQVLDVARTDTAHAIKVAYRKKAFDYHPDRISGDADKVVCGEIFKRVSEAYTCLSDPNQRARYDASLPGQSRNTARPGPSYTMAWRRSARGNLWRMVEDTDGTDYNLVVMPSRFGKGYGFMIYKDNERVHQGWGYRTQQDACAAADKCFV